MSIRISQGVVEIVSQTGGTSRITQGAMEVAVPSTTSPQRFSQMLMEIVGQIPVNSLEERITQASIEIIATQNITARPTQALVEIIISQSGFPPRDTPPQWRLHKFDLKKRAEETS